MDKYLLEILKEVNTIIIPGLGALTITNHATGEIMFMPYLKHDDGKLAAYISEKEGLDETEAKNLIAKYVREITTKLDQGESYDMFQFGSFFKDGNDVNFKNWEKNNSTEEEAVHAEPVVEEVPEPKEEIVAAAAEETSVVKAPEPEKITEEKVAENVPEKEEHKVEEVIEEKPIEAPIPEEPKLEEKKETPIIPIAQASEKEMNILQKEELAATNDKLKKLKEDQRKQKEKKPSKRGGVGFWMLMVLILIIIAGGTYVGLNYDEVKQHIPFLADEPKQENESTGMDEMKETLGTEETAEPTEEGTSDVAEEESTDLDQSVVEKVIPEEKPVTQVQNTGSNNLPFHLIAGAFSSEANANRLADKLRAEGYSVKVGPGAGMHLVSIKSFATRAEAEAGKADVSSAAPKAWVYEWR